MSHFLVLVLCAGAISVVLATMSRGSGREKLISGLKIFGEFTVISLALAWLLYFIPW
ncbi:MAG: hypothetical protein ACRD63_05780 [Pyrinomonadaceae bacterium]